MFEAVSAFLLGAALLISCSSSVSAPTIATPSPTTTPRPSLHFTTVDATSQPAGSTLIELVNYEFRPSEISVTAGKVVFYLVNSANEPHSIRLRDEAGPLTAVSALSTAVAPGHSAVFTIDDLPAGTYRMTEPIPGAHGDANLGMVGRVTSR